MGVWPFASSFVGHEEGDISTLTPSILVHALSNQNARWKIQTFSLWLLKPFEDATRHLSQVVFWNKIKRLRSQYRAGGSGFWKIVLKISFLILSCLWFFICKSGVVGIKAAAAASHWASPSREWTSCEISSTKQQPGLDYYISMLASNVVSTAMLSADPYTLKVPFKGSSPWDKKKVTMTIVTIVALLRGDAGWRSIHSM